MRGLLVRHFPTRKLAAHQALDLAETRLQVRYLAVQRDDDVIQLGDRLVLVSDLFFEVEQARIRARHGTRTLAPVATQAARISGSAKSGDSSAKVARARPQHDL